MKKEFAKYLLDKNRKDYNLISADFSRTRSAVWEEVKPLFDYIKRGDKVLDLGCGNGRYQPEVKSRGGEYIGIDNSERLVAIARQKYPEAEFKTADALNLPFDDESFDKIYSIAVLHHFPSKELRLKFLEEAKRVLKKDGLLIITVWKFHQIKEWRLLFRYTTLKLLGKSQLDFMDIMEPWGNVAERYYHWFRRGELSSLEKEAGFKIKEGGITKNQKGNRQNYYIILQK